VISTAKVITSYERAGRPYFTKPGSREWATVIEAVNACGWGSPGMTILEGKVHLSTWYKESQPPYDGVIEVSENGWTNTVDKYCRISASDAQYTSS
jgi:hypothetical protein